MKKCIISLILLLVGSCTTIALVDRSSEFYEQISTFNEANGQKTTSEEMKKAKVFYTKMTTCTPAKVKYQFFRETVSGKTKDGYCRYFNVQLTNKGYETYDCKLPMAVALGYSSSMLGVIEFAGDDENKRKCIDQNIEITKLLSDYCKVKH